MSTLHNDRLLHYTIEEALRRTEKGEPPAGFTTRVMAELKPKQPSSWQRLALWMTAPKVFTYKPLQIVPALTCALALIAFAYIKIYQSPIGQAVRLSTVRFVMHDAGMNAKSVSVIGSFNNWKPKSSVMWYNEYDKAWILEAQLPPGDHEYLFLVNGNQFVPDPKAQMTRDDGFGNKNSIIFVNESHEQTL